jgi:outer membrane protein assembly factor BamB
VTDQTRAWELRVRRQILLPPVLVDDAMLAATGKKLIAVNVADGAVRWSSEISEKPAGPPIVGGVLAVVTSAQRVLILDRELGTAVGSAALEAAARSALWTGPATCSYTVQTVSLFQFNQPARMRV